MWGALDGAWWGLEQQSCAWRRRLFWTISFFIFESPPPPPEPRSGFRSRNGIVDRESFFNIHLRNGASSDETSGKWEKLLISDIMPITNSLAFKKEDCLILQNRWKRFSHDIITTCSTCQGTSGGVRPVRHKDLSGRSFKSFKEVAPAWIWRFGSRIRSQHLELCRSLNRIFCSASASVILTWGDTVAYLVCRDV